MSERPGGAALAAFCRREWRDATWSDRLSFKKGAQDGAQFANPGVPSRFFGDGDRFHATHRGQSTEW